MFQFFHPRPVVAGRAVAVKVVQQEVTARQDTRTLVVPVQPGGATESSPERKGGPS